MSDQISCSKMAGEFLPIVQDFRGASQRWRKDRALFSHVAQLYTHVKEMLTGLPSVT